MPGILGSALPIFVILLTNVTGGAERKSTSVPIKSRG
jgi:hypothetical protein